MGHNSQENLLQLVSDGQQDKVDICFPLNMKLPRRVLERVLERVLQWGEWRAKQKVNY